MLLLKISFIFISIMAVAVISGLIMIILTYAAWKLDITFYQSAIIFVGLLAVLVYGGFLYREAQISG